MDLALALLKRGFVGFPRLLIDYAGPLELGYDELGKLLVFMSEPEVYLAEPLPGADFRIRMGASPDRYRNLRERLMEFADLGLVFYRENPDGTELVFNFQPMLERLEALVREHEALEAEAAAELAADIPAAGIGPEVPGTEGPAAPLPASASFLEQVRLHAPILRWTEQRLGRPLGDREVTDILDWINTYGFDDRVVRAIIDEGLERGITRFSYLNQIARRWHEDGIRTLEEAEAERAEYRKVMTRWGRVVSRLGLGRRLTRAEQQLLEKWSKDWGLPDEVILRACDETVYAREPNFAYLDRVLGSWHAQGVRTVADVERVLQEHRRSRQHGRAASERDRPPARSNVFLTGKSRDNINYEEFYRRPGR